MDSPELKPIIPGSSTARTAEKARAESRQNRRESTVPRRRIKHEFSLVVPLKRPPIEHYDEDIVIKPEEEEEGSSRERRSILIPTAGASKRLRKRAAEDVKPVIEREDECAEEEGAVETLKEEEVVSDLESDLTDLDDVEASLRQEVVDEDEESDGYVDVEYALPEAGPKKGKGKAKGKAKGKGKGKRLPKMDFSVSVGMKDVLEANLDVVICGIQGGVSLRSEDSRPYSDPSNKFWKILHESGFTTEKLAPVRYTELPQLCRMGHVNLAVRETRTDEDTKPANLKKGILSLFKELEEHRPKIVCFAGLLMCTVVLQYFKNLPVLPTADNPSPKKIVSPPVKARPGLQPIKFSFPRRLEGPTVEGVKAEEGEEGERDVCWVYCVVNSSGAVAQYSTADIIGHFGELREQIARMNAGESMINIPAKVVEYRAEDYFAREVLLDATNRPAVVAIGL